MNEYNELIGILARHARIIAWIYDAQTDCLTYWLPQTVNALRINDIKNTEAADEWHFLWEGQPSGSLDVHAPERKDGALFRLTYKRLEDNTGVVGVADVISARQGANARNGGAICDEGVLAARINADMLLLQQREKGVLFAIKIDGLGKNELANESQEEKCIEILIASIHAEFRDTDIFGTLPDERFFVFFRGALSIDVLERRAQHFLDEFSRRALDSMITASCTIGIAVTGGAHSAAKDLIAAASQALDEAMARGVNHYRMYENEKY